jgi:hypothetical protein
VPPTSCAGEAPGLDPDVVTRQETIATDDCDQATEVLGDGYHVTHRPS